MSDSSVNSFVAAMKETINKKIAEIHTAMPGIIQSYDPNKNLANIEPALKVDIEGTKIKFPIITGVPVIFPCGMGGEVSITWPIQKGDNCLLIFAESQIDEWLLNIESDDISDVRRFDLTDAICIPGLCKSGYKSLKSNPKHLTIKYKDNFIKMGDKIEITSGQPVVINADLKVNGKISSTE